MNANVRAANLLGAKPTTTLARIRAEGPRDPGYRKLVKALGGVRKYGKDTPITVRQIVEINGLDDALWCLRTMPEHGSRWRLLAVRYARRVQHLMKDPRSVSALDVAERYARGLATDKEMAAAGVAAEAAWVAAWDAAGVAAWAAARAAWVAARAAARAAWVSAWVAAGDAAWAAARDVAWVAAEEAERVWQADELLRICEEEAP